MEMRGRDDDNSIDFDVTRGNSERGVHVIPMSGEDSFVGSDSPLRPELVSALNMSPFAKVMDGLIGRVTSQEAFENRHELTILEPFVTRPEDIVISQRQETRQPHFAEQLEDTFIAMMADQAFYTNNISDTLTVLRKVTFTGRHDGNGNSFAIDGLRRQLPDFQYIRTVSITDETLRVTFSHVFDQERIAGDLEDFGYRTKEGKDFKERKLVTAFSPDGGMYRFGPTYVELPLNYNSSFDTALTRFIEFVAAVRFKNNWLSDNMHVRLHKEVAPIMQIMFGDQYPREIVSGTIASVIAAASSVENLEQIEGLNETHSSKMGRKMGARRDRERTFRVLGVDAADHIDYITIREGEPPLVTVQFNCEVDNDALRKELEKIEDGRLFLTSPKTVRQMKKRYVNKSRFGGPEIRRDTVKAESFSVLNEEGQAVLTFKNSNGKSVFFISVNEETVQDALRVMDPVYDDRMLITAVQRSREIAQTGLTAMEGEILSAFRQLTRIYRFFLLTEDEKKSYEVMLETGSMIEVPTPEQWVIQQMKAAGDEAEFHERVLHVLDHLNSRISPEMFHTLGKTEETQERARQIYGELQQLKGRFDAMVTMSA
jgi:hypothetical protein